MCEIMGKAAFGKVLKEVRKLSIMITGETVPRRAKRETFKKEGSLVWPRITVFP